MRYLSLQLWIVKIWQLLKMARSLSLQLHSCQLQLTTVTQGTICLGVQHAPVRPVGHGQTLYPPVIVSILVYIFQIDRGMNDQFTNLSLQLWIVEL